MKGTPTPIETQAFSHFSRVVCYAKGTTKIGSFLERKKLNASIFYFKEQKGYPLPINSSTNIVNS